jgi:hypothetical protein
VLPQTKVEKHHVNTPHYHIKEQRDTTESYLRQCVTTLFPERLPGKLREKSIHICSNKRQETCRWKKMMSEKGIHKYPIIVNCSKN